MSDKTEDLKDVGQALFGERWQSDLARALGIRDSRRIRQFMSEARPIPDGIWADLVELMENRKDVLDHKVLELKKKGRV